LPFAGIFHLSLCRKRIEFPQPSRRKAQEQLCKKLNALNAYIPIGKILQIEVGCSPI
jgi:hypothetical protein